MYVIKTVFVIKKINLEKKIVPIYLQRFIIKALIYY